MSHLALPRALARDPHKPGRSATPLELFFDLVFVVAVALASHNLHHFESDDHFTTGIVRYLMVFFGIWWAWLNFTWFASAFDSDDWLYRVLVLAQMAGALIMAAGVPRLMNDGEPAVMFAGYVLVRLALIPQWLRVAAQVPAYRTTARRYAGGIALAQAYWLLFQFVPDQVIVPLYALGGLIELSVPVFSERA